MEYSCLRESSSFLWKQESRGLQPDRKPAPPGFLVKPGMTRFFIPGSLKILIFLKSGVELGLFKDSSGD